MQIDDSGAELDWDHGADKAELLEQAELSREDKGGGCGRRRTQPQSL